MHVTLPVFYRRPIAIEAVNTDSVWRYSIEKAIFKSQHDDVIARFQRGSMYGTRIVGGDKM